MIRDYDDEPGNWLDKTWSEMKASQKHKREITIPWDKVFDKDNTKG